MNGERGAEDDGIRFADILTTAAAVANYLGEGEVRARHLLRGIEMLRGTIELEDLGRPLSPLVRRASGGGTVAPEVQGLVQRWFAEVGTVNAEIAGETLARLIREIEEIEGLSRET